MIIRISIAIVGARTVILHYSTTCFEYRQGILRVAAAINPPLEHVLYHSVPMVQPNSYSSPCCRFFDDRSGCFQQPSNGARGQPGQRNVGWVRPSGLKQGYVSPRCVSCAVHRGRSVYTLAWEQYNLLYYFITRQKKQIYFVQVDAVCFVEELTVCFAHLIATSIESIRSAGISSGYPNMTVEWSRPTFAYPCSAIQRLSGAKPQSSPIYWQTDV